MTNQHPEFDLAELAAEAAQQEAAEVAAYKPTDDDVIYLCHGSDYSRSVR